ncbi:menaquinone biosynthetic enzyme MqnA/MqnD family protein [Marinithermus hydrothermalis]|uniref:Chorismate dehydratase n=1 Tax=Marinithermus hydrothermalis (strain DSM 14884 / JCM 11576 / T1) TaxID=869210 RepID=F2NPD8_MARHT|nr:menaquinone biosynthesis protein [Marinithermus hydrothermalis]AEB12219.1 protein of unknown function DUF178 [Marinithermus hydrothermalis DSM 14884]
MYTLGIPPYANTAPLFYYLEPGYGLEVRRGVPTELNRWLLTGEVDLSLVSAYFYLQHQDRLCALPDFSVAVLGPVYSVNLFHRVPWTALRRVAVTTESATSVRLLEYLIAQDGVYPEFVREAGGLELLETYDGVLLIGDRAIQAYAGLLDAPPRSVHHLPTRLQGLEVTDLSMRWFERTRLPFVFAVWATRKDAPPPPEVVDRLREARSRGLGHLAAIAREEAERLGVSARLIQHYLWNFRYHLEVPDRLGLEAFARAVGLPEPGAYWEV